ncbi:MAG: L-aspartate oxidase [Coxiellaceae bacterium]|nr:L-aspartate oxidase [Coxiellaceae bacterium]
MHAETHNYDILIIGSGAAGLALALSLADHYHIALISKADLVAGSSPRAQGGIAAVMSESEDSLDAHIQDTLNAGADLCDKSVVEFVVRRGKKAIEFLMRRGVGFTHQPEQHDQLHLTQEGGHSHRRILHVADKTGVAVVKTLAEQALSHPRIDCFTEYTAIDLVMQDDECVGATMLHNATQDIHHFIAHKTVLATGGASGCYRYTSNSNQATGDGIAMAWRAGCRVANLEFNQFHPTCLYHPDAKSFLISEVMRGEGAVLRLPNGERFMQRYDQREEMAPRDIVARAIEAEIKSHACDYVLLDISHLADEDIKRMFPTIYQRCLEFDIDITQQAIPVVPAAHYTCGGVMADLTGATDIANLFAIGEVAYTGLHGANRMASNSLLECLVFAASASEAIRQQLMQQPLLVEINSPWLNLHQLAVEFDAQQRIAHVQDLMWRTAGIVRCDDLLLQAHEQLQQWFAELEAIFSTAHLNKTLTECRNMVQVALLIIESALQRHESRGLHYNVDHPEAVPNPQPTILMPPAYMPSEIARES